MKNTLVVLTVAMLLGACASMESFGNMVNKPTVTYQSVALGDVSSDNIELKPTFSLLNTNNYPIPVDTVDYTLSLNGQQLFDGVTQPIGTLEANKPKEITLAVNLTGGVLKTLQRSLLKTKVINYKVAGHVKVMGIALPFEHEDTIYVPQVKLNDFKVVNASSSRIEAVAKLTIDNQNEFQLPLDNISYSIASQGRHLLSGSLVNQQISQGINKIEVPLSLATGKLVTNVFSLISSANVPLDITVSSPLFNTTSRYNLNLRELLQ